MPLPVISCIIPAFNCEGYLGEAIDSVLAQTYHPVELIVVDDGSTDGTPDVAATYDRKITCLHQANRGLSTARNTGIKASAGKFLAFLDADDVWHPDKLQRQMTYLAKRPHLDFCFTGYRNFWIPELAEEERKHQGHPLVQPDGAWSICTLLTPRGVFRRYGLFCDGMRWGGGMIWILQALGKGATPGSMPDVLMYRRIHRNNLSRERVINNEFFLILRAWRDYKRLGRDDGTLAKCDPSSLFDPADRWMRDSSG